MSRDLVATTTEKLEAFIAERGIEVPVPQPGYYLLTMAEGCHPTMVLISNPSVQFTADNWPGARLAPVPDLLALLTRIVVQEAASIALREALLAVCKACPPPDMPHATRTPAHEAHILAIKVLVEIASLFGEKIR